MEAIDDKIILARCNHGDPYRREVQGKGQQARCQWKQEAGAKQRGRELQAEECRGLWKEKTRKCIHP